MFINNNFKFCYLRIRKVPFTNILEECKYVKEKIKTNNYIDEELKSESDSDSNKGIYIDIDNEE